MSAGLVDLSPNLVSSVVQGLLVQHKELQETVKTMHVRLSDMEAGLARLEFQASLEPLGKDSKQLQAQPGASSDGSGNSSPEPNPNELVSEEVCKVLLAEHVHTIGDSTWESTVFCWLNGISFGASFTLLFVTYLNVVIQITFVVIVALSFRTSDVTMDKDKATEFRLGMGHDSNNMDPYRFVSLASRVCGGDESLQIAAGQVHAVNIIKEYLGLDIKILGQESIPIGPILCTTVLVVWVLSTTSEIREIVSFVIAICQVPRSLGTRVLVNSNGMFFLASISSCRLLYTLSLQLLRLAIVVTLMINGCVFVAKTAGLENLVLNGVALTFVMDVDELLFNMIVPKEIHSIVHNFDPLPRPMGFSFKGFSIWSSGVILFTASIVGWAVLGPMKDTHDNLQEVHEELCLRGSVDFVVGSSTSGIATVGKTNPYEEGRHAMSLLSSVVEELIELTTRGQGVELTTRGSYEVQTGLAFVSLTQMMTPELVMSVLFDANTPCYDFGSNGFENNSGLWYAAAYIARNSTATTCDGLKSFCTRPEGSLIRSYCGQTCGCNSPKSGFRALKYPGCLGKCREDSREELLKIECTASDVGDMIVPVTRTFDTLISETKYVNTFALKPKNIWMQDLQAAMQHGCAGLVTYLDGIQSNGFYKLFCAEGELSPFCPIECGCDIASVMLSSCPPKCCKDKDAEVVYIYSHYLNVTISGCIDVDCNSTFGIRCPVHCGLCP